MFKRFRSFFLLFVDTEIYVLLSIKTKFLEIISQMSVLDRWKKPGCGREVWIEALLMAVSNESALEYLG